MAPLLNSSEERDRSASFKAEAIVGIGWGALAAAIFGVVWLWWGLGEAHAFIGLVGPVFGAAAILLWIGSIYTIWKGRTIQKLHPRIPAVERRASRNSFLLVVLLEFVGIVLVAVLAGRLHRPYLGTDWCALIVGLHLLPLAKIFRAPYMGVFGILITIWCVLSWVLFRPHALVISVAVGTGILLCALSAVSQAIARGITHSLL